jgi:hypothetical protein
LTEIEFLAITYQGTEWGNHVSGFEKVSFPVMPDTDGKAFSVFSAKPYNVFLIDKKNRLVMMKATFSEEQISELNNRIRDLHGEQ